MNYLFLLPQSMLDKLESCGKLSLPHCTLAKITEEKRTHLTSTKTKIPKKGVSSTLIPNTTTPTPPKNSLHALIWSPHHKTST